MNAKNLVIYGKQSKIENDRVYVSEKDFETSVFDKAQFSPPELKIIQHSSIDETQFLQLFNYEEISLYWFFYPTFWATFNNTMKFSLAFEKFLDQINPLVVKIEDDFSYFDIIKQICHKKNIKVKYDTRNFLKFTLSNKIRPSIRKIRLRKITKNKINTRKTLYFNKYKTIHNINKKVIFASSDVYRRYLINIDKGITEKEEFFAHDIIRLLKNEFDCVGIALDYDIRGNAEKLSERLNSELPWMPLEVLLNNGMKKKHKQFLQRYKKLISEKKFQNLFKFDGISIWKQLEPVFKQMTFEPYIPFWLNQIDSLMSFFSQNKPKAIFLPYETGPLALGFIVACKKHGIKTIGIQHGVIADNWRFYSIDPIASNDNPYGFPLPDKIILFGNHSKQILLKNGYPEHKLISFGNPVFFNLSEKIKVLEKKNLYEEYGIKKEQTVILYTTISLQKFKSWSKENRNTDIWHHLLKNFSGNKNFFLILKPHPDENMSMYEEILKNYDSSNVKITKTLLYELSYLSTVVVSMFSTAIIDSLCYKKPVIQVMFDNVESPIQFDKYGVVIPIRLEDLSNKIHELLNNPELVSNLLKNSDHFLKELYNIPEVNPKNELLKLLDE